jgi:hypothetical protein
VPGPFPFAVEFDLGSCKVKAWRPKPVIINHGAGRPYAAPKNEIEGALAVQGGMHGAYDYWPIVRTTLDTGRLLFTDSLSCCASISSYFDSVVTGERDTMCTTL